MTTDVEARAAFQRLLDARNSHDAGALANIAVDEAVPAEFRVLAAQRVAQAPNANEGHLLRLLGAGDGSVVVVAMRAVVEAPTPTLTEAVVRRLRDPHPIVVAWAVKTLASSGSEKDVLDDAPLLAEHPEWRVRAALGDALSRSDSPDATKLLKTLASHEPRVFRKAFLLRMRIRQRLRRSG